MLKFLILRSVNMEFIKFELSLVERQPDIELSVQRYPLPYRFLTSQYFINILTIYVQYRTQMPL
jgi:hypothetical protein